MATLVIGYWARRTRPSGAYLGYPHKIESVIAGDMITKCGKRMKDDPDRPFRVYAEKPPVVCMHCE